MAYDRAQPREGAQPVTERWQYQCEDDVEAHGFGLLLQRQGIVFTRTRASDGTVTLECVGESAIRARAFESEMLEHHVTAVRRSETQRWAARDDQRDRRLRWLGIAVMGAVFAAMANLCG